MEENQRLPQPSRKLQYHYDQETGIFVKQDEISLNWFVSQVLGRSGLQITKISDEDIGKFVFLVATSDMRLPNGQHIILWIKDQLRQKCEMAKGNRTEVWDKLADRYRFLLQRLDMAIVESGQGDLIAKNKEPEPIKKVNRTPNNMKIFFD